MWTWVAAMALQAAAQPALPGWMAGCWESNTDGRWTEECWTGPRGGIMLGSSRSGQGEKLDLWEMMQMGSDQGRLAFWASPNGANRTMFVAAPGPGPGVTFVNPDNDYPQRIRYWREGDDLHAEISLADGSEAKSWRFSRQRTR